MAEATADLLFENYPRFAAELLSGLSECLLSVRSHFGGDLDRFLIFLTIAIRTAEHPAGRAIDPMAVRQGAVLEYPSLYTNVRSIAESTGLPYETVRRKLQALIEAGWIERKERGLSLTVQASHEFRPIREKLFGTVLAHHELVQNLTRG